MVISQEHADAQEALCELGRGTAFASWSNMAFAARPSLVIASGCGAQRPQPIPVRRAERHASGLAPATWPARSPLPGPSLRVRRRSRCCSFAAQFLVLLRTRRSSPVLITVRVGAVTDVVLAHAPAYRGRCTEWSECDP
jgi:hypothetical protein